MQQLKQLQEVQEVWVLKWRVNKMNLSKRMKSLSEIVDRDKFYEVNAGLELVKKTAKAKFDE